MAGKNSHFYLMHFFLDCPETQLFKAGHWAWLELIENFHWCRKEKVVTSLSIQIPSEKKLKGKYRKIVHLSCNVWRWDASWDSEKGGAGKSRTAVYPAAPVPGCTLHSHEPLTLKSIGLEERLCSMSQKWSAVTHTNQKYMSQNNSF